MKKFEISGLDLYYGDFHALKNINLDLEEKQITAFIGPSGCGKSTLLRQLKTVLAPHGHRLGEIRFEGVPLDELDQREQAARIGFVLQSPGEPARHPIRCGMSWPFGPGEPGL